MLGALGSYDDHSPEPEEEWSFRDTRRKTEKMGYEEKGLENGGEEIENGIEECESEEEIETDDDEEMEADEEDAEESELEDENDGDSYDSDSDEDYQVG